MSAPIESENIPPLEKNLETPEAAQETVKLFDVGSLPMSELQEKVLRGEKLTLSESLRAGRDEVVAEKPDHAYRAIDLETLKKYIREGGVESTNPADIFKQGENNAGVDWYLGGYARRYGNIILEAPARADKFTIVESDQMMAKNPLVRHIKSEGGANGIHMENISRILNIVDAKKVEEMSLEKLRELVKEEKDAETTQKLEDVRKKLGL